MPLCAWLEHASMRMCACSSFRVRPEVLTCSLAAAPGCLAQKFSATVVAYAKLPNGTLLREEPLFTGEVHRNGDALRALAEISSAAGVQRHKFTAVDEVAAYQVFGSNNVVDEEEEEGMEAGEQPETVACVLPGDSPSVDDISDALKNAFEVTEAEMLQMVGPGGCAGDVTRYVAEMGGVTTVACIVDNLKFELVTEHHVACAFPRPAALCKMPRAVHPHSHRRTCLGRATLRRGCHHRVERGQHGRDRDAEGAGRLCAGLPVLVRRRHPSGRPAVAFPPSVRR